MFYSTAYNLKSSDQRKITKNFNAHTKVITLLFWNKTHFGCDFPFYAPDFGISYTYHNKIYLVYEDYFVFAAILKALRCMKNFLNNNKMSCEIYMWRDWRKKVQVMAFFAVFHYSIPAI